PHSATAPLLSQGAVLTYGPGFPDLCQITRAIARSILPGDVAVEALAARFGPEFGELVERREGRDARRQLDPRQFAAGEDVDVGRDPLRLVERPRAQQHGVARRRVVFAP